MDLKNLGIIWVKILKKYNLQCYGKTKLPFFFCTPVGTTSVGEIMGVTNKNLPSSFTFRLISTGNLNAIYFNFTRIVYKNIRFSSRPLNFPVFSWKDKNKSIFSFDWNFWKSSSIGRRSEYVYVACCFQQIPPTGSSGIKNNFQYKE